jgi:deoxyribodipyrimidine photo-lyase
MPAPAIVWFRQDLRLADNPALCAAAEREAPILALYVLDDDAMGKWAYGGASRWWLHHSLAALARELAAHGIELTLRRGPADIVIPGVLADAEANAVFWNRLYEPWAVRRDSEIETRLRGWGVEAQSFSAYLLFEPRSICSDRGEPFRVFSPFWRACLAKPPPARPLPAPKKLRRGPSVASETLEDWRLLPEKPDWAAGLRETWTPGERAALEKLAQFCAQGAARYGGARDMLGHEGVSRLSPHLHFGEVSPREVWHEADAAAGAAAAPFLRQLGWREYCHHVLFANPHIPERPLDASFSAFPWRDDPQALEAWRRGETGYPLVDAAMRQLWLTGWMHNRARLVAGSFLVKHLLLPWQAGEDWFWDTLVDANLADNALGWQWVAGCGADAAPYFRIFNPVLQGQKFDPDGAYVRRYVAELARLDAKYIHAPWQAPKAVLAEAGVVLGKTYPQPIVEHAFARKRALEAFAGRVET